MHVVFVRITLHHENYTDDGGYIVPPVIGAILTAIIMLAGIAGVGFAIRDAFTAPRALPPDIWERFKLRLRPLQQAASAGVAISSIGLFALGLGLPGVSDALPWTYPPFAVQWQAIVDVGLICMGLGAACTFLAATLMKRYLRQVLPADAYEDLFN